MQEPESKKKKDQTELDRKAAINPEFRIFFALYLWETVGIPQAG